MRSRLATLALVFALAISAKALDLWLLWSYNTGDRISGLAFSDDGNLGAASWDGCAYVFDQSGTLLNKVCGGDWMDDASYCCGRFGFVNLDDYAYITDESGNLIEKVYVGDDYDWAITMLPDGFIAGDTRLAYFDLNGNKGWDVDVGYVDNGPSVYGDYVYVADDNWNKLLILKLSDGSEVNEISYDEYAWDAAVCGNYLAVVTAYHLYLYSLDDPANPMELWGVGGITGGWQVAFSPDCEYVAVADWNGWRLYIYDLNGNKVLEKGYGSEVTAIAWWQDRLAVGLDDGTIYVYKGEGYAPSAQSSSTTETATKVPGPFLLALIPMALGLKRARRKK